MHILSLAQPDPLPNASLRKGSGDTAWNDLCKWNLVGVSKCQMNSVDALLPRHRWLVNLACNQTSLVVVACLSLPQLMNTSVFHQNVGEGNKSLNAMSPDPLLSKAFGKGSGCARLCLSLVFCFVVVESFIFEN